MKPESNQDDKQLTCHCPPFSLKITHDAAGIIGRPGKEIKQGSFSVSLCATFKNRIFYVAFLPSSTENDTGYWLQQRH